MEDPSSSSAACAPNNHRTESSQSTSSHSVSHDRPSSSTPGRRDVLNKGQRIVDSKGDELYYRTYRSEEEDLPGVKRLIDQELSEPYNVLTFRYFLNEWPHLTFLVFSSPESREPIATIMCKQEPHRNKNRGYIGMLSVDQDWRRRGIASKLAQLAIREMANRGAHEITLETEHDNQGSLALYESLGFIREKRIHGFYSNLKDAFRLILRLPPSPVNTRTEEDREGVRDAIMRSSGLRSDVTNGSEQTREPRIPRLPSNPDLYT